MAVAEHPQSIEEQRRWEGDLDVMRADRFGDWGSGAAG